MSKFLIIFSIIIIILTNTPKLYARTTPEDILNAKRETYNQTVKNYSPKNQQKLEFASKKIAEFNQQKTDELEDIMVRQGEILDEFIHRSGVAPKYETDGIHRVDNPIDNAEYWLTFAHEAVAYQAAKVYVLNLSGEGNIKADINSQINTLHSDLNVLKDKVIKSQKIISTLVTK